MEFSSVFVSVSSGDIPVSVYVFELLLLGRTLVIELEPTRIQHDLIFYLFTSSKDRFLDKVPGTRRRLGLGTV